MNWTAVLHSLFGVLLLGGFFASGTLRIVLFAAGAAAFVAGLIVARRDTDDAEESSVAES